MSEYNEIHVTNEDPITESPLNNDEIPGNMQGIQKDNAGYSEFGSTESSGSASASSRRSLLDGYDLTRVAATFAVASVVAMAVVIDDSPFGELFDPVLGIISESFGFGGSEAGYSGDCVLSLVEVTDTDVTYSMTFSVDPGDDVSLRLTNVNTDRTRSLTYDPDLGAITGSETGLKSGMKYTISVVVSGETVASRSFTTLTTYDSVPTFTMVGYKCHCGDDGYFYFRFSTIDRDGVWGDWSAVITYDDGSTAACVFAGEPTDTQKIAMDLSISDVTARLTISCKQTNSDGTVTDVVQYDETVYI